MNLPPINPTDTVAMACNFLIVAFGAAHILALFTGVYFARKFTKII